MYAADLLLMRRIDELHQVCFNQSRSIPLTAYLRPETPYEQPPIFNKLGRLCTLDENPFKITELFLVDYIRNTN
uniref:Uncharacterized protein n=1 Tax=Sinorhizobium saheli TaxID=36856 RepID=D1CTD8_SINSA|nr:hypothetical protein [Sinorhizobium saheli]